MFDDAPGLELTAALASCRPEHLGDDQLIDMIHAWERSAAWVAASQLAAIAELCRRRPPRVLAPATTGDQVEVTPGIAAPRR